MLARIFAPALVSFDNRLVEIECDMANGLPGFVVVGLPDKAIEEARERVKSAIRNSGLILPAKRITLNLAPADLPKDGTGYDLGMAVAILVASGQIDNSSLSSSLFLGELALDGSLRPVKGSVLAAQLASEHALTHVYVATDNAAEAALTSSAKVIAVPNLLALFRHLVGETLLSVVETTTVSVATTAVPAIDLANVYGQPMAKRALEIAAAGGHNILLSGPPGAGKTLLSKALIGILPPPTFEEMIEITKLYSLAGLNPGGVVSTRPFRAPHHTASSVALIGGGTIPKPGEISLSHQGILFLDELPEFPRSVLEVLRQPLEDGTVTVARAARVTTFPARFMLVATRNPCPCGYAGDTLQACNCSPAQILRYQRKLSGPLLDRIDLIIDVTRVEQKDLVAAKLAEPSSAVAARVQAARERQQKRFGKGSYLNSSLTGPAVRQYCRLDTETSAVAGQAISRLSLSARSYNRILKVSRTIADLAEQDTIALPHFMEALQYRSRAT